MSRFLLTSTFDDCFEYCGETIQLNLSFDNILRVFELFNDPMFSSFEKIDIGLEMLIIDMDLIESTDFIEKQALFIFVFKEFLGIDLEHPGQLNEKRVFDFEQDAGIIYASFLHAYKIDLFEQQGKLHYHKFIQLLCNLPDKSRFKEIVNIRQMDLPKPDKHNAEYRKNILKMKSIYALDQHDKQQDAVKAIDQKWDALAQSLKPRG